MRRKYLKRGAELVLWEKMCMQKFTQNVPRPPGLRTSSYPDRECHVALSVSSGELAVAVKPVSPLCSISESLCYTSEIFAARGIHTCVLFMRMNYIYFQVTIIH